MVHVVFVGFLFWAALGLVGVQADEDDFDLPATPACTRRRGPAVVTLEEGRRICPSEPAVVHFFELDHDDIATFTLRFTEVEGRRDANSGMQVVDADGNTLASRADLLVAENDSLSQLVIRGDSAALEDEEDAVCGHANRILISCGTACVTYTLQMTRESRVGFNEATKTLSAATPEIPRSGSGTSEFCGSLNVVQFCTNVHWWKVWLRPDDVLLMNVVLEAPNSNIQMQLLDEDRVTLATFFNVAVGGPSVGRREESEIYRASSTTSGLHFLRLSASNDIFEYKVAFQVLSSLANLCQDNDNSGEDDANARVVVPLRVKCKKFRKSDPMTISSVCQDSSSGAAQACPTTCASAAVSCP